MAKSSARRAALTALRVWRQKHHLADFVIAQVLESATLRAPDRAFALDLFYGVLRNLTLLDFWIVKLRDGKIDPELRDLLRLGLYQLLLLGTPSHAAVHETVALARKSHTSVTNGILRTATRRKDELIEEAEKQTASVQFSHPEFLFERWRTNFGEQAAVDLCLWNNRPPPLYARVNILKTPVQAFLQANPGSFLLPNQSNFVGLAQLPKDSIARGDCYVQDPSTRIACELCDPQPGETVLDACAAPGGKTAYLAERMQNTGTIVACDQKPDRLDLLQQNLERLGTTNTQIAKHNWLTTDIPKAVLSHGAFDRILIDAPCTNTGVMRRRVDVRWRLQPEEFLRMQRRQIEIVAATVPLLKPNGVLIYSTCSIELEENQGVVQSLLKEQPALHFEREETCLPFRDGFDGAYAAKLIKTR